MMEEMQEINQQLARGEASLSKGKREKEKGKENIPPRERGIGNPPGEGGTVER